MFIYGCWVDDPMTPKPLVAATLATALLITLSGCIDIGDDDLRTEDDTEGPTPHPLVINGVPCASERTAVENIHQEVLTGPRIVHDDNATLDVPAQAIELSLIVTPTNPFAGSLEVALFSGTGDRLAHHKFTGLEHPTARTGGYSIDRGADGPFDEGVEVRTFVDGVADAVEVKVVAHTCLAP